MEIRINERAEIERTFIYDIDEIENTLETEVKGLDSIVEELNNY